MDEIRYNIYVNDLQYYYQIAWLFLDKRFKLVGDITKADVCVILADENPLHHDIIDQEKCDIIHYQDEADSSMIDFQTACSFVELLENDIMTLHIPIIGIGKTANLIASMNGATIISAYRTLVTKCKCNHTDDSYFVKTSNKSQLIYYSHLSPNKYNVILEVKSNSPYYFFEGNDRFIAEKNYKEAEIIWMSDKDDIIQSLCIQSYPHQLLNFAISSTVRYYRQIIADYAEGLLDYGNVFGPKKHENEMQLF